jgi:hypothetical protein
MGRCLFVVMLLLSSPVWAATYYVDYAGGDDAAAGTSESTAWKHVPGDNRATDAARAARLAAGDVVLLKGGVTYRGSVRIPASGKPDLPITYRGDGWGQGNAVIDGGAVFGREWTRCESAKELRGNAEYKNVYWTKAPEGYGFRTGTYEGSEFLYVAQDPAPSDPFHFDRIDQLRKIPAKDATVSQTSESITDPRHFTQSDPAYYDGACVLVWHTPNITRVYKITGFDPATHTIRHEKVGGGGIYSGRDTYYGIANHPAHLSGPGQYWHDEATGRLYVWPRGDGNPADHEYSTVKGNIGIDANGRSHVVVEGFVVQKFVFGIQASGNGVGDVTIRNNEVRSLKSNGKYAIHAGGTTMKVLGNRVVDCQRAVGILSGGKDLLIRGNHVERTSRQGIWLMGAQRAQIIGNTVVDISGTHSNGISVYLFHKNVLIAGNRILRTGSALTYHGNGKRPQKSEDLCIVGNLVDGAANSWGGNMGSTTIVNNTFLGPTNIGADTDKQVFLNNIAHTGGTGTVRGHNIYTALQWWQKPGARGGWKMTDGDVDWSKKKRDDLFADLTGGDYRPKPGSPALAGGTDPTEHLPVATFPDYDFTKGIDGKPLARDGKWTIGAFGSGAVAKEE